MVHLCLAVWIILSTSASSLDTQSILSIYDELVEMNITCGNLDNCRGNRSTDDLRFVNCQCGPICAQFDTCCMDSKYTNLPKDEDMRRLTLSHPFRAQEVIFMMNTCKPGWDGDSNVKDLCESDILHDIREDPFGIIPVTNPRTWITYKNYFCFVCNEDESSDSPVLWDFHFYNENNLTLGSVSELQVGGWDLFLADGKYAYMVIGAPERIAPRLHWYRQYVISTCARDWTDVDTEEKCKAYIDLVFHLIEDHYSQNAVFRNPHCAICNHRRVSDLSCTKPSRFVYRHGPPYGFLFVGLFSFEDSVSRCPRNQVFDKFSKKCRPVICGRNQKLVGTECVDKSTKLEASTVNPIHRPPWSGFVWKPPPGSSTTTVSPELSTSTENLKTEHTTTGNSGDFGAVSSPSPSTTTEGTDTPDSFLTTAFSTTTQNPRPGHQGNVRLPSGPQASTGKVRPRPPRRS